MTASALASELRAAGLTVREDPGWERRGRNWQDRRLFRGKPVGVMHHHTSIPVPYPVSALNGSRDGRIKCNINTKPDGTVWLVAYKACNYSSGPGLSAVLESVRAATPRIGNARDMGYTRADDDTNGNPYFLNFENDHPGDGRPIPDVQLDSIVAATRVALDHYGLEVGNVLSHAEWTARKHDPYWDGDRRAIETIRQRLETPMKIPLESWARNTFQWMIANGIYTEQSDLDQIRETYEFQQMAVMQKRMHDLAIRSAGAVDVDIEAVTQAVADALQIVPRA